ncbi:MAG TPA: DUF1553 domain-containing protein [Planctomycetota bacterium]|nr:DUF1553 domain-containing protein [Planctomycetota bacterium]
MTRSLLSAALVLCVVAASPTALDAATEPVAFNRDIRPILAENCFHCHGPDPGSRKARLRLDREEGFFGERDDGPTVVRGKPDESPLYQRIASHDEDEVMPPPKTRKVLTDAQRGLVRRWIAQDAPWQPHWSFIAPQRPAAPAVADQAWPRNAIDRFVLAQLEHAGLKPAAEADRRTLARRVALDITGLPPTPAEVDAFVADRADDAYERLVDRLLASPRYGEHRARFWLDAARYADTHGLHFDNYREMWAYRDWVIAAFNANQRFDAFTIEQIAGDLLPAPTRDQRIATGFHRCNITTSEGGTIEEENLANYARDRVETTSWVWLGLTANCTVCHDHKFDPITAKDFYAFSAYFRNTTQGALDGNVKDSAPVLRLPPTAEDERRLAALPGELAAAQAAIDQRNAALKGGFDAWLATLTVDGWRAEVAKLGEPALHLPLDAAPVDQAVVATIGGVAARARLAEPVAWEEVGGIAPRFGLANQATIDGVADLGRATPFAYGAWVRLSGDSGDAGALFARMDSTLAHRGWDLWVEGDRYGAHLIHSWPDDAIKVRANAGVVRRDTWQHVFVSYDGSGHASGLRLYVDGQEVGTEIAADTLRTDSRTTAPFTIGRRLHDAGFAKAWLRDVRIYTRRLDASEVGALAFASRIAAFLGAPAEQRPQAERDALFAIHAGGDAEVRAQRDRVAALQAEQASINARSAVTHVMEERADRMPSAAILFRGQYDQPKEVVEAAPFGWLHPLPSDAPKNRLGLARWLVAAENPLTPRVIANRLWQELFGAGLVKTSEDFGIMGDAPSHPELLDWLAVELREGWDVKKLIRTMVLSATYRQAAVADAVKRGIDPTNRLLSRGPRFRMDAEMVRDLALSASGALSERIGGPSVKPYQPDGVWEAVGMRESDTKNYRRDAGEALYRRSLYTFWKRMAPPAALEILNAPSRESSCVRRERTNTPMQALVTLNDPQFVEAARLLAQRVLQEPSVPQGHDDDARRRDAIGMRVLARPFTPDEHAIVGASLATLRAHYRAQPEAATALLAVGDTRSDPALDAAELAAFTMLCNQVLNLDEALTK